MMMNDVDKTSGCIVASCMSCAERLSNHSKQRHFKVYLRLDYQIDTRKLWSRNTKENGAD